MMAMLDRKLLREMTRMKGQILAVALVMACGLAMMIMTRSLILTLDQTRDDYYREHSMAELFAQCKRAPQSLLPRIAEIDGVSQVESRVVMDVTLDLPGMDVPATGHMISLPIDGSTPKLNGIVLRQGRMPRPDERREIVLGEAFADAHQLKPGDELTAVINGRRETLRICGIGLSPEFVFEARAGETLPDHKRFSVIWMNYRALAMAYNMDGAFNDLCLDLAPSANAETVMQELDLILAPYGATGSYQRKEQASAQRLDDELRVLESLSFIYPIVFLSVAAFMVNAVLSRMVRLQREQIAQLKAQGYSSREVGWHYLKLVMLIGLIGAILGAFGGYVLGKQLVNLYTLFFRFPELEFTYHFSAMFTALFISMAAASLGVISVVKQAVNLPPAEAMRPEPPASFQPSWLERAGLARWMSPSFRMAVRNIERRPWQSLFTSGGLALATGLMVMPGGMSDSVDHLLTFQWNRAQRHDVLVFLNEPSSARALHDLRHFPGVTLAEPVRGVRSRLKFAQFSRKINITGIPVDGDLNRLLDAQEQAIVMPKEGILMSAKLAEVLGARVGDEVEMEVLESHRPKFFVPIRGLVQDFAGVAAYMEIRALRRLMREGDTVNGAYLSVDLQHWDAFMAKIKETPRIAVTMVKRDQLQAFRDTTAKSIGTLRTLYFFLAIIVAFGVVYNSARISLSERSRELATLRVVGFTLPEVRRVLMSELFLLVLMAIPAGLLFGRGLALFIMSSFSTETVRLPILIRSSTYSIAAIVVLAASAISFALVSRMLRQLDLLGALKARD
ncbi:MAG: FtsX-like permease family protein [Verrucomicrobia bacterium]|nr:MAG: FtsX-like permease family protein [Verrucomicrobiota bacterium]